ncbi:MAG TPA: exopolysaccharide biosynthesis protein [Opitutaceae bacterium]|nr:exopolysaccharide biosynthesis protein [Opitutaceae bacterium]OQB96451.1 MAG: Exopolysaccharide synthesis, ExoD [Verrucomicrobia bacterium ADurb.Bin122]MBP8962408.1 exopolysaccharide biosynthesis protein [Opitutaceae bacterium]HOF10512.1 exopolysaccharide biosynthesis protein [Opitutaceae bacterium]HOR24150.1 exopolysaccharide biosynthesis protein [Opitutaceae bacterium]
MPRRAPQSSAPPKASALLRALIARLETKPVTFAEVISALGTRSHTLALTLLCLPFLTPLPLPGLSAPFGLGIFLIALQLARKRPLWLPRRMTVRAIPTGFFGKVLRLTAWVLAGLERFLRPRWLALTDTSLLRSLHALAISLAALVLLLPLPIPLTNTFPAWVVLLMANGLATRDGLCITLAYAVFLSGFGYFAFLGEAARRSVQWLLAG